MVNPGPNSGSQPGLMLPPEDTGQSGDIFMSQLGRAATGIWWVEARDVLNILPCTGQPPTT